MIHDISLLLAFHHVNQSKSFSKAAKKLGLGLPQVSKKIQKLEEALGARLFHRTTRSVSLTQDGMAIAPKLQQLIEDLSEIEKTFEGTHALEGTLRINCITSVAHKLLARSLVGFQKKYPQIRIDLDVHDGIVDLLDTQTDVAIRVEGPKNSDYIFKKLLPNRLIFVASPEYLKKNTLPKHLGDLKNHILMKLRVYDPCKILSPRKARFENIGEIEAKELIQCQSGMMLTTLCLEGGGIALRSVWDVDHHIAKKQLVQILGQVQIEDFGILNAVVPHRRLISPKVRAFLDFIEIEAKTWPQNCSAAENAHK